MGMILRIASSRIVGQGDIVGRSGYFSLNLSANSVRRGRLDARRTLKSLVADLRVIPLSSALCCYARSKAALYSQGTPIEDLDLFIGCTAVANQMIMVTENKKHLERIPNIEIENWVHRG